MVTVHNYDPSPFADELPPFAVGVDPTAHEAAHVATIAQLLLHLEGAQRCEALAYELLRLCDEARRNG